MNTRSFFFGTALCLILLSPLAIAQKSINKETHSPAWQKEWKQVDSLSDLGLPKSAMEIVERIYLSSKSGKDIPQFIKTVIYKIKLNSFFREDFLVTTLRDLDDEISKAPEPSKQILQSISAEVYTKYYENNRYRFSNRTRLADVKPDSLSTWDQRTLMKVIYNNYLASLHNDKLLKSISITDFKAIIEIPGSGFTNQTSPEKELETVVILRPTLYDFLANRALDFFISSDGPGIKPAFGFKMNTVSYFSQTDEFIKLSFPADDSLSQDLQAIKIYQDLALFHRNDKNPPALVDAELARLEFVKDKALTGSNDSLYLDALKQFENRFKESPVSANISFVIAGFYKEEGGGKANEPLHKYDIKKALEICEAVIKRFPGSEGAKNCRILADNILGNELGIKNEAVVYPGKLSLSLITYKNNNKLFLRQYKVGREAWESSKGKLKKEEVIEFIEKQPIITSWDQLLPDFGDYRSHSIETSLPPAGPGFYVILVCPDPSFSKSSELITYSDYVVSALNYISRQNKNSSISLNIFNRDSGLPMPGINVETWVRNYNYRNREWETNKIHDFISDDNGFVTIPPAETGAKNNNLYCKLINADDVLLTTSYYQYPFSQLPEKAIKQTIFFTDRAVYRPGQTVYYKGILLEKKGEQARLLTHESTRVNFTDVNGRKISEQSFTTNDFGSFNGSFIAPVDVLPGQMYISNESGNIAFSVEEYKRPTFEVSFYPLEGNYKLNETLTVKGNAKAYAGNAIGQANLSYRVVRNVRFPWWERWFMPFPSSPETEIANGITKTASDGSFSISFTAVPDFSVARSSNPVFDFNLTVDVTDINGETQSSQQSVNVGYRSLLLTVNAPEKINPGTDSLLKFSATNLNGRPTPVKLAVSVSRLSVPDRVFLKRSWDKPDTSLLTEKTFHESFPSFSYGNESDTSTWKQIETVVNKIIDLAADSVINIKWYTDNSGTSQRIKPGVYKILLSANDPFGEKVSVKHFLTVYDPGSTALPGSPVNWFIPLKTKAKPGENAGFLIGSKEKDVKVMVETCIGDSMVSRKWVTVSNSQLQLDVPVLENYRGNFSVNFVFSKFNRIFQNYQLVSVPYADNKLNIALESFRSKILPGEKEQWKIHISSPGNKPVSAEFLASMYDASLDAFRINTWSFDLGRKFYGANPWNAGNNYNIRSGSASSTKTSGDYTTHEYPELNWFGLNLFSGRPYPMMIKLGRTDRQGIVEEKSGMVMAMNANPEAPPPPEDLNVAGISTGGEEKSKQAAEKTGFQLRKDFRETAFFYPALVTDSAGGLSLSFTAPESLTKWKFQGFAHTAGLLYNLVDKELVTRKDLMVMPNTPRFVRQGDNLVFSAKVVNLSTQDMKAWAHIELFDGITMKSLDSLVSGPSRQEVSIRQGESTGITWNIRIPESPSVSLLQYRIIAESGVFSDGEEKIIPILPNRMMVTETLPLPVRDKGTFDFSFDKLIASSSGKTLKNYRLTLEFASNPAWYAVQALPALNEKEFEDAYSTFGAFYSNCIASHIMNSDPKIKVVFESWKNLSPDALLSNLEKNSQLKSLLLQQTPWVMEAKTETENRRKLGMYFDPDNLHMNLEKNLVRLQKLQTPGGGWTWFEGMPESRFISQDIIGGLAHLDHLGAFISGNNQGVTQMLKNGVTFIDEAFVKSYEELKRRNPSQMKDNNLSALEIQYLYVRSYFLDSQPLLSKSREALDYYLSQAGQYWTKEDLSSQAMVAMALNRFGKKDVSALIIKSLSERALHSSEMGMYWVQERGYYWHQAPVETQALLIEAYEEVAKDISSVNEMKIWLLKQKQTHSWTSSRATVEACYALLMRGSDLLSADPKIKISLGNHKIDPSKLPDISQEAGTGYFQMSWSGNEITPDMGKVRVSKSTDGIAWGALYWQYFENMDKITAARTSLKLEKKLYLEKNTPSGPVLVSLQDQCSLKTGDKLKVRIVLSTDRELEFVHMRDQRASAFEPFPGNPDHGSQTTEKLSGYRYQDGLGYYQSTTDASTDFFFDYIPRGTYVFEYPLVVNAAGDYSNGITTIQCMYAPEFSAHSEGIRVMVTK
ncbi:MAG: MG2 domain-containing protein [Bacteroidetes bacterium]|nr:MG2 domain-containing protein [Bacteroidota bacterium]